MSRDRLHRSPEEHSWPETSGTSTASGIGTRLTFGASSNANPRPAVARSTDLSSPSPTATSVFGASLVTLVARLATACWSMGSTKPGHSTCRSSVRVCHHGSVNSWAPDASLVDLYIDDERLDLDSAEIYDYERILDLRDGIAVRHFTWRTASGKLLAISFTSSCQRYRATSSHLWIQSSTTSRERKLPLPNPIAIAQHPRLRSCPPPSEPLGERHLWLPATHTGSTRPNPNGSLSIFRGRSGSAFAPGLSYSQQRMTIGVGCKHEILSSSPYRCHNTIEPDEATTTITGRMEPGHSLDLTKLASYQTSRGVPASELLDRCRLTIQRAAPPNTDKILTAHRSWWRSFWQRSDIQIKGDDGAQQAARWNVFHLAQASALSNTSGLPARGLTGDGYEGHYFWDTEVHVVPALSYLSPRSARGLILFRYRMLDDARIRAQETKRVRRPLPMAYN